MRYLLKVDPPNRHGPYVQREGSRHSYGSISSAKVFHTREEANAEKCSNERVVTIDQEIPR